MAEPSGDARSLPTGATRAGGPKGLDGLDDLVPLLPIALGLLAADDGQYASLKSDLRRWAKDDPIDALVATVIGGGVAFYLAERERNPSCAKPWDGILYVATCLSVGYDNLFPTTPTGHAIASLVQTFGPALAGMAFEPPAAETRAEADAARAEARAEADAARVRAEQTAAVNQAILARLDDIVRLLGDAKQ
jgi:hypothetical protein